MKKYLLKNKETQDVEWVFYSKNEAVKEMMRLISEYNENIDSDEARLTPFDFILEEVKEKDVSERITDFVKAREYLGNPRCGIIGKVSKKHLKAIIALNKLFTIAEAWNRDDDFVPDFSDERQYKYFPLFVYDSKVERFVCMCAGSENATVVLGIGSRIYFATRERAFTFGKKFESLWNEVFL